jgi:uncharacterized membrane protein (UPF0127 family)
MPLVNARTDRIVAADVEVARSRADRRRGLLGRASLAEGAALVIASCCAVHTIGMRFAIDVVFVNSRGRVRKIVRALEPWRMAAALFASAVIEFPAGALDLDSVCVGDRLYLTPAPVECAGRSPDGVVIAAPPRSPQPRDRRPQVRPGIVPKFLDSRMPFERGLDEAALDAAAAPVHDSHDA